MQNQPVRGAGDAQWHPSPRPVGLRQNRGVRSCCSCSTGCHSSIMRGILQAYPGQSPSCMRCSLYPNREGEGTCENDLRGQGSRALPRLPPRAVKREMFPRAAQEPVRSITTRRMHCSKTISEVFTGDAPNRDQALGLVAGGNQQSVSLDE